MQLQTTSNQTETMTRPICGMNPNGRFYVDSSMLSAWFSCSMKNWLRYLMGRTTKEEKAPVLAGTAAHAARAVYFKCGSIEEALREFEQKYKGWASVNIAADDKLSFQNTSTILHQWLRGHERISQDGKHKGLPFEYPDPTHVEIPWELPLDEAEGLWIMGRMDGLPNYQHGYCVEEFKTTSALSQWWRSQWDLNAQVTTYLWAGRQLFNVPIAGVFVHGLEFGKLPSDDRKCYMHKGMKYPECRLMHVKWELTELLTRSDAFIEGWYADALGAARKMRDLLTAAPTLQSAPLIAQEGMFNRSCQFCDVADACRMGRQPHLIEANFLYEPWSPFDE